MTDDGGGSPTSRRLRVLVSAYAGGPGEESEANAGWEFAAAAARRHDVWFVTRVRFRSDVESALAADPELAAHMHVHYLELSERLQRRKRRPRDVYWYYWLWQRALGRYALRVHQSVGLDVAHHTTFASDWLPVGLVRLPHDVPLVWGPVGGTTYLSRSLARWFSPTDLLKELVREVMTRLLRRCFADPVARRAAVVVAQNKDVARRFAYARRVVLESNSALTPAAPRTAPEGRRPRRAVFVGRLIAWKGPRLAVAAMSRPAAQDWTLDIYGSGPETSALRADIDRLGLADRVTLLGQRPRAEILAAYADADAMLFPSMHDSAPWAVAEASTAGCPIVCLDLGGPPLLAAENGIVVRPGRDTPDRLAEALEQAADRGGSPTTRWLASRLPAVVDEWYRDAVRTHRD